MIWIGILVGFVLGAAVVGGFALWVMRQMPVLLPW